MKQSNPLKWLGAVVDCWFIGGCTTHSKPRKGRKSGNMEMIGNLNLYPSGNPGNGILLGFAIDVLGIYTALTGNIDHNLPSVFVLLPLLKKEAMKNPIFHGQKSMEFSMASSWLRPYETILTCRHDWWKLSELFVSCMFGGSLAPGASSSTICFQPFSYFQLGSASLGGRCLGQGSLPLPLPASRGRKNNAVSWRLRTSLTASPDHENWVGDGWKMWKTPIINSNLTTMETNYELEFLDNLTNYSYYKLEFEGINMH